jgi:hypothetical protein
MSDELAKSSMSIALEPAALRALQVNPVDFVLCSPSVNPSKPAIRAMQLTRFLFVTKIAFFTSSSSRTRKNSSFVLGGSNAVSSRCSALGDAWDVLRGACRGTWC